MTLSGSNTSFLFPLSDGLAVEAVYYGSGTLCISTQAGCAVGCPFCASGSQGLKRNLTCDEMAAQVREARLRGTSPKRITLSGIGEPLHNAKAVCAFMAWCRSQELPVSLTTTGDPLSRLAAFLPGPDNGLMLSLHAGTAATHRALVPGGPDYEDLWQLLFQAWSGLSRRRRRRIGVNYLLLAGVNDTDSELTALVERLKRCPELTLHLLTLNPGPASYLVSPDESRIDRIHADLTAAGYNVRRANRWRRQAKGGCGTLMLRRIASVGPPGAGSGLFF